jgi:hypothetical protein
MSEVSNWDIEQRLMQIDDTIYNTSIDYKPKRRTREQQKKYETNVAIGICIYFGVFFAAMIIALNLVM